jgi:hypothetical protein
MLLQMLAELLPDADEFVACFLSFLVRDRLIAENGTDPAEAGPKLIVTSLPALGRLHTTSFVAPAVGCGVLS